MRNEQKHRIQRYETNARTRDLIPLKVSGIFLMLSETSCTNVHLSLFRATLHSESQLSFTQNPFRNRAQSTPRAACRSESIRSDGREGAR
jgi:hypothetical protein